MVGSVIMKNAVAFLMLPTRKKDQKGLVVVVVVGFMKKMVGFLSRVWGKKHIWWWVFSSEETKKTTFALKNTTVEQLPSTVNTSYWMDVDRSDKLSDRCSLKDWLGEFPSTMT